MPTDRVLLILDSSDEDRAAIEQAVAGSLETIHSFPGPDEAWAIVQTLDTVDLMIAGIDGEVGKDVFDFRDHLHGKFGIFPSAFCSREDMTPFYDRVVEGERLFFKPIDAAIMKEWLTESENEPGHIMGERAYATENDVTEPINPAQIRRDAIESKEQEASAPPPSTESAPVQTQATLSPDTGATATVDGSAEEPLPEQTLPIGTRLGDYKLLRLIQEDNDFALYEAEQTSIGRKVALKTLFRKHRKDINWVQAFVDEASSRASVNHANISLVYECVQERGVNFYTLELVDAPSLSDLAARRSQLSNDAIRNVLTSAVDALSYLRDSGMQHRLLTAQTILLQNEEQTRIANPVRGRGVPLSPQEETRQMELLGDAIDPFLRKGETDPALFSLVDRMGTDRIDAINSIEGLKKALGMVESAPALSEKEIAAIQEKESNRTAVVAGTIIGLFIVLGGIIAMLFLGGKPTIRELDIVSRIPDGAFPYQDGDPIEVNEFWLGQYEVTISQYSAFLDALAADPGLAGRVKHPDQPAEKTNHIPNMWDSMKDKAFKGRSFSGADIDPNCPIVGVDWWDAYAYAKWRGGRLPTEQEWEKAARGRAGTKFPWGDEADFSKFNSGKDQKKTAETKPGEIDGYHYWNPVDALHEDEGRYGTRGLAGNVSEWTATWDSHPTSPDKKVPMIRGASFNTTEGFEVTTQRAADSPNDRNFSTGFRIAGDKEELIPMTPSASPPAQQTPPTETTATDGDSTSAETAAPAENTPPAGESMPTAPATGADENSSTPAPSADSGAEKSKTKEPETPATQDPDDFFK